MNAEILPAASWALLIRCMLLPLVASRPQRVAIEYLTRSMDDPSLTPWERRRELLALLLHLDQLDEEPSGLLEGAMT